MIFPAKEVAERAWGLGWREYRAREDELAVQGVHEGAEPGVGFSVQCLGFRVEC